MMWRNRQARNHVRRWAGALVMLFAFQVVVAGFCLLTREAHAAPMPDMSMVQTEQHVGGSCAQASQTDPSAPAHSSGDCFHCNKQTPFVKTAAPDVPAFAPLLAFVAIAPEWTEQAAIVPSVAPDSATGPPRSSSLLFTTTRRIRV